MVAKINAVHLDISERLNEFIHKKIDRLYRRFDFISEAEVTLKVVKPETAKNKEASVRLHVPATPELFATKTSDTFEEAVTLCLEALERQLEKTKDKK